MVNTDHDEELATLIAELVRIETENPPGNEKLCSEFIVDWFNDRNIDATLVPEPYPDRPQAVARVGEGEPTLVLNGHIDVVPAGDRDEWSVDPYAGTVDGDRLYGRGSVDMKTGVAIGMMTLTSLQSELENGPLNGSIVFQAAIGEETAEPGTKTLLEQNYDGDYGVVLEPTGLRTATREKGLAWYEITVQGEPSHASRPDQGTNAIDAARPILDALKAYDEELRSREDELLGSAYATVTMVRAGTKENVVPENAMITVDRRFLPDESVAQIDAEIDELVDSAVEADTDTMWERTRTYESAAIPEDNPLANLFRERSAEIADISREPWGIKASTDVRNMVNDAGMEAITWGPGDIAQAHTYDEHMDLSAATDGLRILQEASREILNGAFN